MDGTIGKIQVGAIIGTTIDAGGFGTITVNPGRIIDSTIHTEGDIAQINAAGMLYTDIIAEGTIGRVSIGSAGISRTLIQGVGGIESVAVRGTISEANISAQDTDLSLIHI